MKPIPLTQKHKSKLLKMCIFFYPELHKKAFDKGVKYYDNKETAKANCCGFYITGNNHIQCSYPYYERDDSFHVHLMKSIHWFEFCMTHLVEKILNPHPEKPSRTVKEHFQEYFWFTNLYANKLGGTHPIDYLYEQFKKLT